MCCYPLICIQEGSDIGGRIRGLGTSDSWFSLVYRAILFDMLTAPIVALDHANKIIHVYIPGFDGNRLGRLVPKGGRWQGKRLRSGKCVQYIFFLFNSCLGQGIQAVLEAGLLRAELAFCQVCNRFGLRFEQGGMFPSHFQNQR
jgi:hypothetical protein